jgi:catechol 2,3-dioxygenase-like lactoylglutathione lyase family enzyme
MTPFTLDHVGFGVKNLDAAAERFGRLGFNLTPRGHHVLPPLTPGGPYRSAGTSNNCAMLERGYLELIGVTDPTYAGSMLGHIERYEGLHIVAFGASDWTEAQRVLRDGRLPGAAVRPLQRPIDGDLAQFQIIDFSPLPEGVFFAIHHGTPELLWKPEFLAHPNGATALHGITVAVPDPADFAARLGHLLGITPPEFLMELARGTVRVVDSAWLEQFPPDRNSPSPRPSPGERESRKPTPALPIIAGITLRSSDLEQTAAILRDNEIDFQQPPGALFVPPEEACGGFIEFVG